MSKNFRWLKNVPLSYFDCTYSFFDETSRKIFNSYNRDLEKSLEVLLISFYSDDEL